MYQQDEDQQFKTLPAGRRKDNIMDNRTYKSFDELPLTLTAKEVSDVLGISLAGAYELTRSDGFPAFKLGNRTIVHRDKFIKWLEDKCDGKI